MIIETAKNSDRLADELNPEFLFQGVFTQLLLKAANGEIDLETLAKKELANRGLDASGKWVGPKNAAKALGV